MPGPADQRVLADVVHEVFHLAAAVGVKFVLDNPLRSLLTNIRGTEVVLEAAHQNGNKKVVLFSSSEVYGKGASIPFRESDDRLLGPTSVLRWSYAASKAVDEFLALGYFHERRLPVVVVRCFNTCGPRQSGRYGMVIPRLIQRALSGQPMEVYGDGEQTRCFCHVEDTIRALGGLMDRGTSGEIYNVGSANRIGILELARRVIEVTGSSSEIRHVPYEEVYGQGIEDMLHRIPSIEKVSAAIGWQPERTLVEILADVIDHVKTAPALAEV